MFYGSTNARVRRLVYFCDMDTAPDDVEDGLRVAALELEAAVRKAFESGLSVAAIANDTGLLIEDVERLVA